MKAMRPVIVSNGILFLQMRSMGSQITPGREKEGKNGAGKTYGKLFIHLLSIRAYEVSLKSLEISKLLIPTMVFL